MTQKSIKWTMFIIVAIGNFIAMLDSTSVNLGLYEMSKAFEVSISQIQWVVISYMLVLTVFLPFFGKLGDIFPKNKIYSSGFLIFALGSLLNSFAENFWQLIIFRCVEAFGASIMISNASAVIASIFKNAKRGKALGLNGCVIAIGGMSGPALGGFLLHSFDWRAMFLPCVPIALIGAVYAYRMLPSHISKIKGFKFDYAGFLYFTVSIFTLLLAISEGHQWGWKSFKIMFLGLLTLVFGTLFYLRERRIENPMIDLGIFKIKTFTLGNLAVMTSYMAMFTNAILLPFFLQEILKFNPMITGLLILPYSVTLSVVAPISGNWAGKHGSRVLTMAGPLVYIVALLIFTMLDEKAQIWQVVLASGIMGIGNGLFQSPSNTAIITSVDKTELGIASGILALSRNMGNIMGVALTISIFDSLRAFYLVSGQLYDFAFLNAYHQTMMVGVIFGIICFILSFNAYKNNKI